MLIVLCFVAWSNNTESTYIDFNTFLKEVNSSRKYLSVNDLKQLDIEKYTPDFYDSLDDVSMEEAQQMMKYQLNN